MSIERVFDACGVGNGLLDICIQVSEEELARTSLQKGAMTLAEPAAQKDLLEQLAAKDKVMMGGGSIANSIAAVAQLGGKAALLTRTGNDHYGKEYRRDFLNLGIGLGDLQGRDGPTGTCISLLTPDGERTMQTALGVSADFCPEDITPGMVEKSRWLLVEGYLILNPGAGLEGVQLAVSRAREAGCEVALSFSDAWLVKGQHAVLSRLVDHCSLIFCNEEEAVTFTGAGSATEAFQQLCRRVGGVAMTAGARGAYCAWKGDQVYVPGVQVRAVDTTGAGDMFAGAMLYGICQNIPLEAAVKGACGLCARVVSQAGARLSGGIRGLWEQAGRVE